MNATVTDINKPKSIPRSDDELLVILQRDAATRAVYRVIDVLEADLKRAKSEWKEKRSDATKAYREHLRDEEREALRGAFEKLKKREKLSDRDKSSLVSICDHYFEACEGLAKHDDILAEGKADKDKRKKQIDEFKAAHRELSLQAKDGDGAQIPMFEPSAANAKPGLVMTDATRKVVYSALMQLSKDGAPLDEAQRSLLIALGNEGVEVIELGVNAAAAIERTDEDDEEDDEDGEEPELAEDGDETDIPF